jgi:putative phosphoesterase
MRILLLADIHANWPALQAIDEPHDVCACLGDLVDYALEPVSCIDWVRRRSHYTVRGNHDHGVAQDVRVSGRNGFKYLTGVTRALTRERLAADDVRYLAGLPVTQTATLGGKRFLFVHATPRDPLDEYAHPDPDFWARRLQNVEADVVCVGHTHQPYVLPVGDKLVVNPGSVGQPRDGDPRASYAVIEDNRVELKRAAYPVEATIRVVQESNLPDLAKQMLGEVFRTGKSLQKILEELKSRQ